MVDIIDHHTIADLGGAGADTHLLIDGKGEKSNDKMARDGIASYTEGEIEKNGEIRGHIEHNGRHGHALSEESWFLKDVESVKVGTVGGIEKEILVAN